MSDTRRPGPGLVQIKRLDTGWDLLFEGYTEVGAVGGYLWPAGVPEGVQINALVVVEEPAQVGEFELTGLTLDAQQSMEPWIANWFAQEALGIDDSAVTPDPSSGATSDPGEAPVVNVKMDENQLVEWVHGQLEGTHMIGDVAEIVGNFADEGSALAAVGEILGPTGVIASTIIVLWATVRAFGTGTRIQEQMGFCYGVMWEIFGLPNGTKAFHEGGGDNPDDLREAFFEGVAEGREKAQDVKVHNAIMMKVAYYIASGQADRTATLQNTINELWKAIRETDLAGDWLAWPNPEDMPN